MKPINRRAFLKTSVAGTLLAASPASDVLSASARAAAPASTPNAAGRAPSGAPRSDTVIVSDLSRCEPAGRLVRGFEAGCWQLIAYETTDGTKGNMVSAIPEEDCGELTLPLGVTGPHRIYIATHDTKSRYEGSSSYGRLEVKLSSDPGFRRVGPEDDTRDEDGATKIPGESEAGDKMITEAYWRTADLTGQSLTFRQPQYPYNRPEHAQLANLAWVRLDPLNEDDKRQWAGEQPRKDTGKLGLIFCTGQFTGHTRGTYTFHPTSRDWFKDEFEPYRNSDIKLLIFEAMRGNYCLFKTRIGDMGTEENQWRDEWVEPLAEFTRLAHADGMKIFASMRMIGPQFPTNRGAISRARHYWQHPEWTRRSKAGVPMSNWSLAYDGVRRHWLELLREALERGIDGLQLHLNRSEPFVFYEEPVVQSFQEQHGVDPRSLSHEDPRWIAHCAGYVTRFIREVRALVDEKPGRELAVTISGRKTSGKAHYEENQCDLETWIREGLVDYIMATPYFHLPTLRRLRALAGDRVHLWPDLMPRAQSAASYARLARTYYGDGADGLCLWDGERRAARISEWAAVRRLGHEEMLDRIEEEGPSLYRGIDLKYLGGFDVKWSFKDG